MKTKHPFHRLRSGLRSGLVLAAFLLAILILPGCATAQLGAYLSPAETAALMAPVSVPADIAATTWRPAVTSWWLSPPLGSILSVPGPDGFGGTPFMLGSPTVYTGPFSSSIIPIPAGEDWRIGYASLPIEGAGDQLVAFVVKLPPGWSSSNPTAGISRVVQLASGSGDCRGRSAPLDLGGFNPPGVLFLTYDMRFLSLGLDAPGSPGSHTLKEGRHYLYHSIHLSNSVPWDVWGYSAGGGTALTVLFDGAKNAHSVTAIAPIMLPWNVYDNPNYVTPAAPAPPNPWASIFALGTSSPPTYRAYYGSTIVPLVKAVVPEETYVQGNPFRRLVEGKDPKPPAMIVAGSNDGLGAGAMVLPLFLFASHWTGNAYPVFYTASDASAGRSIDFAAIASAITTSGEKGNVVGVILDGGTHDLITPYGVDMRALALAFAESLP